MERSRKAQCIYLFQKKAHTRPVYVQIFLCKSFPRKIIWVNFKPLCYCNFTEKIRKIQSIRFSHNLSNLILGSFWLPFGPKTWEQRFSQKITLLTFKVTSYKESKMFHTLTFYNTSKTFWASFLAHFGSFSTRKLKSKITPKTVN